MHMILPNVLVELLHGGLRGTMSRRVWAYPTKGLDVPCMQGVSIVDDLNDLVFYPNALLRHLHFALFPPNDQALNVTLQVRSLVFLFKLNVGNLLVFLPSVLPSAFKT